MTFSIKLENVYYGALSRGEGSGVEAGRVFGWLPKRTLDKRLRYNLEGNVLGSREDRTC